MSSLRNAVRQRTHRERGQLPSRKHLGHLEKHKDYVLRARDYHFKEKRLAALRQKAYFRNPDEFYFKMINTRTKDGVHIAERSEQLPEEMRKLLKTRDLNYVSYVRSIDRKKIDKLQGELQLVGAMDDEDDFIPLDGKVAEPSSNAGPIRPTHTFFVDTEQEAKEFDAAKKLNTLPELVTRRFNRPTIEQLKTEEIIGPDGATLKASHISCHTRE
jgi:U3 small nucleolar RNA-associated protein 11